MIKVNLEHVKGLDPKAYLPRVKEINRAINERTLPGNDYLGWADYPDHYDKEEFARIQKAGEEIAKNYDALVVCGIGGSYLGARAAIEGIQGLYPERKLEIIFMGQTVAASYVAQVMRHLKGKKFAINVISKSGTTTETAVAFRLLRDMLVEQVGKEAAAKAIYATTDKEKGALLGLSKKYGYERFVLPSDIGGRYSVFTAVGLLPMAAAGIDIAAFMEGAKHSYHAYDNEELNACYQYAVARHYLYQEKHLPVEMFVTYEPRFVQLGEWFKQLFGESEGKDHTGILPDSATFTTDLHSLGQYIQEGSPILFETVLSVEKPEVDVAIPHDEDDLDGLNYLDGKTLDYVSKKAHDGTVEAHVDVGGVPNVLLSIDKMDAFAMGELMYFFCRACAMSAYLNKINPFNQPGVEVYKKNMFRLLGKPGYQK